MQHVTNFWKSRKVAMTGATGFLGYHTALELSRKGAEVLALVRAGSDAARLRAANIACELAPLENQAGLRRAVTNSDVVVHLAGAVGFGNQWKPFYQANVAGTLNLLEAAGHAGIRRFVHVSSIVAVGATRQPEVLDENAVWNLRSLKVPYVTTKRRAEEAVLECTARDMEVVVVNPACVVGPDDFTGSEFGTLCRRFWKGRLPFHFGGGNNFVDVRDVAAGIALAAEHGRSGQRYLLTGENQSYSEFFRQLCQAAGRFIPRLRLPNGVARLIGYFNDCLPRRESKRAYLSSSQAALMGLYFFFDAAKARTDLGYYTRPWQQTLADAHAFWMASPRSAA